MNRGTTWVLGAGPGIGLAAAARFQSRGDAIGLVVRPGETLDPFRARLGPTVPFVEADVFDPVALREALHTLEANLGPPSVLIYNASTGTAGPWETLDPTEVGPILARVATSLLVAVQAVRPTMRATGSGTVLVTGGGLAFDPKPGQGVPAAVKALQRSLTLSLAKELEPEGIHVATLAVCGFVQPHTDLSPDAVAATLELLASEPREHWTHELRIP